MKPEKLIYMANQIATFFRSYPEDEAIAGIRDHLKAFWTPRMRAAAIELGEAKHEGLDPFVLSALQRLSIAESPVERATAGPGRVGELGSDAG